VNDTIRTILWVLLFGGAVYLTFRYLWPLVLFILLLIAFSVFRIRRLAEKSRREAERMVDEMNGHQSPYIEDLYDEAMKEERRTPNYQDQLFQEQVNRRREEAGEIVDVEFTRKEEKAGEGHDSGSQ
jgi:hypothetical protein